MRAFDGGAIDVVQVGGARIAAAFAQAFGNFGNDGMQTHFKLQPGEPGVDAYSAWMVWPSFPHVRE
ncbi:hypothetical protein GCM10007863_23030 [Dyella mobilis]|nr:hypothetical protein GCM10007863_23030 [Dyella mobilis]